METALAILPVIHNPAGDLAGQSGMFIGIYGNGWGEARTQVPYTFRESTCAHASCGTIGINHRDAVSGVLVTTVLAVSTPGSLLILLPLLLLALTREYSGIIKKLESVSP